MRLWSIQQADKLAEIRSTGKLTCSSNQYSLEWGNEYKWMIKQMNEKIGSSKKKINIQFGHGFNTKIQNTKNQI